MIMKKIVLSACVLFIGLFIFITWVKKTADSELLQTSKSNLTKAQKDTIVQFWAFYKEATTLRLNEQWDHAAEKYKEALLLDNTHEDGWYYLGNMYLELDQYIDAEKCWKQLIQLNSKNSRAYMQLADLYINNGVLFDLDKAEQACRTSLKINKEETGPVQLLGEVHLIRGDLEQAARQFESVAASNFKSVDSYYLRGYIDWKNDQKSKALNWYKKAIQSAQPNTHVSDKVLGEGDTKTVKGFGSVTSKSVFQPLLNELATVSSSNTAVDMEKQYQELDILLNQLKSRIL